MVAQTPFCASYYRFVFIDPLGGLGWPWSGGSRAVSGSMVLLGLELGRSEMFPRVLWVLPDLLENAIPW